MAYSNELGTGYSNLLDVTIENEDEGVFPDIPGYPIYFFGMIVLIAIVPLTSKIKKSTK
jgi:hypothetical protein